MVPVRAAGEALFARLQSVVRRLAESKGHYANLADAVCSDETWAVREEGRCWNGATLGQYTHTIAGVGVAAQKYNPEMKAPDQDDLVVMALDEKLQKMSRLLRQSITPELPQADSYVAEGSGSGIWTRNRVGDDEDYDDDDEGSGSGHWGVTKKPSDFSFNDNTETRDNTNKVKDSSSAPFCGGSAIWLLLALLLVTLLGHL